MRIKLTTLRLKESNLTSNYHRQLKYTYGIDTMLAMNANDYPALKDVIIIFKAGIEKRWPTVKAQQFFYWYMIM